MKTELKDKCQEIANMIQARLAGFDKGPELFKDIEDKDERIQKLEGQVKSLQEKFDRMWQAWHNLAIDTKGAEEAAKMAQQLKAGK